DSCADQANCFVELPIRELELGVRAIAGRTLDNLRSEDGGGEAAIVAARDRRDPGQTAAGDGEGAIPVLVAGKSIYRVLRGWEAKETGNRRKHRKRDLRCARASRRNVE